METQKMLYHLQTTQGVSLRELASRTGLSKTAIHRAGIEGAPLVMLETLHVLLVKGYRLSEDSPTYRKIYAQWGRDRISPLREGAKTLMDKVAGLSPAKRKALEKFLREM